MARRTINIQTEIAKLGDLNRSELCELWIRGYGCAPPAGLRQPNMLRSAAWQFQRDQCGPMPGRVHRQLVNAMKRVECDLGLGETNVIAGDKASSFGAMDTTDEISLSQMPRCPEKTLDADGGTASPTGLEDLPVAIARETAYTHSTPRSKAPRERPLPVPGSRLIREWNGRSYIVDVVADGYLFDGKTWRSLTAIAKRITGIHRSGPEFFGL